jgi:hypothetical protein
VSNFRGVGLNSLMRNNISKTKFYNAEIIICGSISRMDDILICLEVVILFIVKGIINMDYNLNQFMQGVVQSRV